MAQKTTATKKDSSKSAVKKTKAPTRSTLRTINKTTAKITTSDIGATKTVVRKKRAAVTRTNSKKSSPKRLTKITSIKTVVRTGAKSKTKVMPQRKTEIAIKSKAKVVLTLAEQIKELIDGKVTTSKAELEKHSRDTSLFQVMPEVVVYPRSAKDVMALVKFAKKKSKTKNPISLTGRAGGSDMTGGPLNTSVILNFTKYMNGAAVDEEKLMAYVDPGLYYRDFDKEITPEHITLPSFPASWRLAALGGMIMNNSGGEKTLRYGQTRDFVDHVWMVCADGNEYSFGPINKNELTLKMKQKDEEGRLYRETYNLIEKNYDLIKKAEPKTSKNSAGYALWRVWDRETGIFDLSQLFTGSQGTLGLLTRAQIRLVKEKQNRKLLVLFFKSWDDLPKVVNTLLPLKPEQLEVFDDATLKLGLRFMPEVAKKVGSSFIPFALKFLPEAVIGAQMLGLPKLIVLAEFAEDTDEEVEKKINKAQEKLSSGYRVWMRVASNEADAEKYWIMRRESFSLLREHVNGKRTVPLVEDFCVPPAKLPKFLPKGLAILKKYGIKANVAGHAGNGNLHIIPLMDLTKVSERDKLIPAAKEFYDLVIKFGGTITAEHNDGILRTPFLEAMYGEEMMKVYGQIKTIFDPDGIFNPGKKVGGTLEYFKDHLDPGTSK